MVAPLVPNVCSKTITHEVSTTILVGSTSQLAWSAVTGKVTFGKPNIFIGGISSTCSLTFGKIGRTGAVVSRAATRVSLKNSGKIFQNSCAEVKVGDTFVVHENTT